ncbi:MAG: hypothetical protein Harvfovirus36_9 [Harvfovirus sp.]|uniref:Pathogenicity locus n=1 Tax=Harvfovirus sp. TaxID=2487768 RepID=A0A3G5A2M8_9VIRU|nr:MAG: hypothetical protein Harvfovirus36_9 [Harvfovirus sp.]
MKRKIELKDLYSVGEATLRDFALLGIKTVSQLKKKNARSLYVKLSKIIGQKLDPCVEDVFSAAIAQARNPALPKEQRNWWYWSKIRKLRKF